MRRLLVLVSFFIEDERDAREVRSQLMHEVPNVIRHDFGFADAKHVNVQVRAPRPPVSAPVKPVRS